VQGSFEEIQRRGCGAIGAELHGSFAASLLPRNRALYLHKRALHPCSYKALVLLQGSCAAYIFVQSYKALWLPPYCLVPSYRTLFTVAGHTQRHTQDTPKHTHGTHTGHTRDTPEHTHTDMNLRFAMIHTQMKMRSGRIWVLFSTKCNTRQHTATHCNTLSAPYLI